MNTDLRKKDEGELEKECRQYGVQYVVPAIGEISQEERRRHLSELCQKAKNKARMKRNRGTMTVEERAKENAKDSERKKRNRAAMTAVEEEEVAVDGLHVETTKRVMEACMMDQRTAVGEDEEGGGRDRHHAHVCVICDRFIIGTEKLCKLTKEGIEKHSGRLGVENYETYYGMSLKPELIKQYQIDDMPGLLLSPRSRRKSNTFDACENCVNGMRPNMTDKTSPPRHAIANGFVIGHIPQIISTKGPNNILVKTEIRDEDLTDILCSFLSPIRAYGYMFAYSGGDHKAIQGHFSFFEVDQSHVGGVMNYFRNSGPNRYIYCMLHGRMTPQQKTIARERAVLDTRKLMEVLTWFIRESGHKGFINTVPP